MICVPHFCHGQCKGVFLLLPLDSFSLLSLLHVMISPRESDGNNPEFPSLF